MVWFIESVSDSRQYNPYRYNVPVSFVMIIYQGGLTLIDVNQTFLAVARRVKTVVTQCASDQQRASLFRARLSIKILAMVLPLTRSPVPCRPQPIPCSLALSCHGPTSYTPAGPSTKDATLPLAERRTLFSLLADTRERPRLS